MLRLLFIVILLAGAYVGVRALVRSIGYRRARGKSFRVLAHGDRLPADVRRAADEIILDRTRRRAARRRGGRHDAAYVELRTQPKPKFSQEQLRALRRIRGETREDFLSTHTPGPYQYIIIFIVASVAGLVLEMVWMYVSAGLTELRVGLVWGPFSPLYGVGACLLTMVLWNFRKASPLHVFVVSAVLGGALEQTCGMVMEYVFNAQSWTYLYLPDHITQWVAWRFLAAWGLIGLLWCRWAMPEIIYRIGEPTARWQVVMIGLLTVFMIVDILATLFCFYRKTERDAGIPPANAVEAYVDEHFTDQFIADRFQNLVIGGDL